MKCYCLGEQWIQSIVFFSCCRDTSSLWRKLKRGGFLPRTVLWYQRHYSRQPSLLWYLFVKNIYLASSVFIAYFEFYSCTNPKIRHVDIFAKTGFIWSVMAINFKCNKTSWMKNFEYAFMCIFRVRGPEVHQIPQTEAMAQERLKTAVLGHSHHGSVVNGSD